VKQVKVQFVRIAPQQPELAAQPVLHRQRQLDAAGAGPTTAIVVVPAWFAHALEQRQPALVETMDRLDRHGVLGGARTGRPAASSRC
jgi:hypothetical protein